MNFKNNAIITTNILKFCINSGEGGLDAQDFTKILKEMYLKWFKKQNINFEIFEKKQNNSFFGVEIHVKKFSQELLDKLQNENGKHKLIRISLFNKKQTRETSFCYVNSIISNNTSEIDENKFNSEIRIDRMRAGGAGGQHVNKTESAIRVTHLPTGIQASCQDGRNQHENKKSALDNLKRKLLLFFEEKSNSQNINQTLIRTYVFNPTQYIKNEITNKKTNKLSNVLNGELELIN